MPDQIDLNLYCDEIKEVKIEDKTFGNEKWAYIGVLIVPVMRQDELITNLLDKRCGNPDTPRPWGSCNTPCRYHEKNNKEVHYSDCNEMDVYFIADRWLDFLLNDKHLTYFYIVCRQNILDTLS